MYILKRKMCSWIFPAARFYSPDWKKQRKPQERKQVTMKISWIHFSDLHLKKNPAVETRLMHMQLPTYLASMNLHCDYAFCTGDIREHSEPYTENAAAHIREIIDAVHVPIDNLFIIPGNHDINAKAGGSYFVDGVEHFRRNDIINKLTDWHTDYYDPQAGKIAEKDLEVLAAGKSEFIDFLGKLYSEERVAEYTKPHFLLKSEHFNILHIDTALTYGIGCTRDFIIGTASLMDLLVQLDQTKPTVLLTHYSFDFLSQAERNEIEQLLYHFHVRLWIAGHEHENLCRLQRDKFYEFQCGNMELQKGAKSCFLIGELDLDTGDGVITVHAWYPQSGWAPYPFARKNSEDDTFFPFALRLPGNDYPAAGVSREQQSAREAFFMLEAQGGIFNKVHLNTALLTDLECGTAVYRNCSFMENGDEKSDEYPLHAVLAAMWRTKEDNPASSCHGLILGDGGMGKSTMMYHECRRKLYNENMLAVYVSLQALEGAHESIEHFVLRSLYKSIDERARNKLVRLTSARHSKPGLTLFIDGFNELSREVSYRYVNEIKMFASYAGVQIVISSRLDFLREFGLSHFWMIRTCDLREEQIQELFPEVEWRNIQGRKNLRILLRNPMMALLYANTCPIMEQHRCREGLTWKTPIKNASDLLYNYYLAQGVLMLERNGGNQYKDVFRCFVLIEEILPELGYLAESCNIISWTEDVFDKELGRIVTNVTKRLSSSMPLHLRKIKRKYGAGTETLEQDDIYTLVVDGLCLLREGQGRVSFTHQIYRDYLAAVYLYKCLSDKERITLWHEKQIHAGIVQYLRYMVDERFWRTGGLADSLLLPYRGVEAVAGDWLVENVLNCWLATGEAIDRNLTGLDLRELSLAEHLKQPISGTINLDHAKVSRRTFLDEKRHDRIIAMAFSHDCRILAAVSANGIVSITNIMTQSQMIVGQMGDLRQSIAVKIGFDADDYLMLRCDDNIYIWSTISFDTIEMGIGREMLCLPLEREAVGAIEGLKQRLRDSELMGCAAEASENGKLLAVGFDSGYIQVWDVQKQDCIAYLSMGDSKISTVSFTKDGKVAALGAGGKLVQIIDLETGKCIKTLHFDKRITKVRFPGENLWHPDNTMYLECRYSDGSFHKIDLDGMSDTKVEGSGSQLVSAALIGRLHDMKDRIIKAAPNGNAIVLDTKHGIPYTWDQKLKQLNPCPGHMSNVTAVAICSDADSRFAASYSGERFRPGRGASKRDRELENKVLVRVRIVKTGQCQWRLPTEGRKIEKLQFFTSNRIILAAFAANGDILMWELINQLVYGEERGHWEKLATIKNHQNRPVDCTVAADQRTFISAYDDGIITIRPFQNDAEENRIATFPGIDLSSIRWETIDSDRETIAALERYKMT